MCCHFRHCCYFTDGEIKAQSHALTRQPRHLDCVGRDRDPPSWGDETPRTSVPCPLVAHGSPVACPRSCPPHHTALPVSQALGLDGESCEFVKLSITAKEPKCNLVPAQTEPVTWPWTPLWTSVYPLGKEEESRSALCHNESHV